MELSKYYIVSVSEVNPEGDLLPTSLMSNDGVPQLYMCAEEAREAIAKAVADCAPDSLYLTSVDAEIVTGDPRETLLKRMEPVDGSSVVAWWSDGTRRGYTINEVQV